MDKKSLSINEFKRINESLETFNEELAGINLMSQFENDDDDDWYFDKPEEEGDQDLGAESDIDDALDSAYGEDEDEEDEEDEGNDMIDDALNALIDEVGDEYEEDSAVQAVFDAVSSLVDDGSISDIPSDVGSEEEKAVWLQSSMPKIRQRLQNFGIDLSGGAETVGGARY